MAKTKKSVHRIIEDFAAYAWAQHDFSPLKVLHEMQFFPVNFFTDVGPVMRDPGTHEGLLLVQPGNWVLLTEPSLWEGARKWSRKSLAYFRKDADAEAFQFFKHYSRYQRDKSFQFHKARRSK